MKFNFHANSIIGFLQTSFNFQETSVQNKIRVYYAPVLIIVMPVMLKIIAQYHSLLFDKVSRGTDILTRRSIIWDVGIDELIDFSASHIFGYGAYGQAISKVSYKYGHIFQYWETERPELFSLHNFALQTVFDIGYIGLIILMVMLGLALKIADNLESEYKYFIISGFLYFIFAGATDIIPTFYNITTYFYLLLFMFTCVFFNDRAYQIKNAEKNYNRQQSGIRSNRLHL